MKSVITKTESDMMSQPTGCDNVLHDSNFEEASASTEIQSTSIPAAIIVEVFPFFHTPISCLLGRGSRQSHMRKRTTVRSQQ